MTPTPKEPEPHAFAFASFDSLEGVPVLSPAPAGTPGYLRLYRAVQAILPGGLIAVVVALAASWLSDHYGAPVMLFALLLGMAVNFVGQDPPPAGPASTSWAARSCGWAWPCWARGSPSIRSTPSAARCW